jgi:hypothetical protein
MAIDCITERHRPNSADGFINIIYLIPQLTIYVHGIINRN